ncbi:MAG TPA: PAS domain S-box protein [Allosphingosinicella sp.]|nr:PAS domain S-box protein [Allosphingosinicella sp.]
MGIEAEIPCVLAEGIASSLNAIVMIDPDGIIHAYNPTAEKLFGYPRERMMGASVRTFIADSPARHAELQALLRFILDGSEGPGARRAHVDGIAADGRVLPLEATITALTIGGAKRFMCSLRDLSPEQQHDEEMQNSIRRLELAVEGAKLGTWTFDLASRTTWYSQRSKEMYGLPADTEMTTAVIQATIHPDHWDSVADPYFNGFHQDKVEVEYQVICPSGEIRWIYSLGALIRDDQGVPRTVNGIHLDITDRKRAEEELEETRRHLELAVDGAGLGIWTVDPRDGTTWYSDRSRDLWGVDHELHLDSHTMRNYIHPDDWEKVLEPWRRDFPGDAVNFEHRVVWPNGDIRWVQSVGKAIRGPDGIVHTLSGIHLDVTERKRAEVELARSRDALHQSEKLAALGSLLAGVSHELNNPLAAIVGQAEMLEEDSRGTAFEARAKKISAAADRCAKIVQTFLAMARRREPQRAPVHPSEMVSDALQLAEYQLRTAGIVTSVECAPGVPSLMGDRDQLHQVLVNLIINAQQALEASATLDKKLAIRITPTAEGRIAIDVCDNGPGISADVAGRIFEPFFTTKPQGVGTGVGLSFSHGIVEAHGGSLKLLPSAVGATFRIELPAAEPVEMEIVAPVAEAPVVAITRRRALVVDDEPDIADTIRELLEREGFAVDVASDGAAALMALDRDEYDVVLSDLRMPGVSGPEMYQRVREIRPHLLSRIAFVTGDTLGSQMDGFLKESGRPVLEKPFTRAGVRCLVAALIDP